MESYDNTAVRQTLNNVFSHSLILFSLNVFFRIYLE